MTTNYIIFFFGFIAPVLTAAVALLMVAYRMSRES